MRKLISKSQFSPIVKTDRGYAIEYDMLPAIPAGASGPEEKVSVETALLPLSSTDEGVQAVIIAGIKNRYSNAILAGFQYDSEHFITLSEYDQTNFSRLYAMAGLPSLYPLTVNIGRSEDQHTITFDDRLEFDAFMTAVNSFIEDKRAECRRVLAEIDWSEYVIPND